MTSAPPDRASRTPRNTEDEISLADLLLVFHRRRWLLLGCLLLGGLAGIGALSAITPLYDARALLIIEPAPGGHDTATVPTAGQTPDSASVDSQVQILASRSLARETIEALGLQADPELTGVGGAVAGPLTRLLPGPATFCERKLASAASAASTLPLRATSCSSN